MNTKKMLFRLTAIVVVAILGCNRKFDSPPNIIEPNISANTSIKALKAMHTIGGLEQITNDIIVCGIVVADDKSGNLYKSVCIQDSTGGITVKLDGNNLYAQYPVGRKIYIRCNGLWLSDYGKLIQLGLIDKTVPSNPSLTGIPNTLFDSYITKGSLGNLVTPKTVSINQFNDSLQSMLIQIKDSVQFAATDTALNYADTSASKNAVNRTISDCSGNNAIVYTSGYANFAGIKTPKGKGILTAIYYVYKTTPELILRDTCDVRFTAPRCAASTISIAALKNMYTGSDLLLGSMAIRGIVISNTSNLAAGNIIIQNENSGIDLYFGNTVNTAKFNAGDSILVDITGGTLTSYKGMMEISLPASALPSGAIASGRAIVPQIVTISQLTNNISTLENTLVQINNATAASTSGTTYSGNKTLADASGTTTLFTSASASFANTTLPASCQNWIGYANRYTTVQFQIRGVSDVSTGSGCLSLANFIANYSFANVATTSGTSDPTKAPAATGVTFGSFTANGLGNNSTATGRFSFSGWPLGAINGSNTFTGILSSSQYFEVTITPLSGYTVGINSIAFTLQRSATGVRQWAVRSNIDQFTTNLPASINPSNNNLLANTDNTFQITDRTVTTAQTGCTISLGKNFCNVSSTVTFRFYGFNAESTNGTFSLNAVTINGYTH